MYLRNGGILYGAENPEDHNTNVQELPLGTKIP